MCLNYKVIVKGFSQDTKRLLQQLKNDNSIRVVAITDKNIDLIGTTAEVQGECVPIIHIFDAYKLIKGGKADKVILASGKTRPTDIRARVNELVCAGLDYENVGIVPIECIYGDCEEIQVLDYKDYDYIDHLEFHLTNRCNLNCKGCDHYVPIIPSAKEVDYNRLKKDLSQLRTKIGYIGDIDILGGEPFLSDNLSDCIYFVRGLYPYSRILIVTNGILVSQMGEKVMKAIKENNAYLMVTQYYTISSIYSGVFSFCTESGIKVIPDSHIARFFKKSLLSLEKKRDYEGTILSNYTSCGCTTLEEGRLYACSTLAFTHYYNDRYSTNYPLTIRDGIDIYDDAISGFDIYKFLKTPKEMCAYCYARMITDRDVPDFIASEEVIECSHTEAPKKEDWVI